MLNIATSFRKLSMREYIKIETVQSRLSLRSRFLSGHFQFLEQIAWRNCQFDFSLFIQTGIRNHLQAEWFFTWLMDDWSITWTVIWHKKTTCLILWSEDSCKLMELTIPEFNELCTWIFQSAFHFPPFSSNFLAYRSLSLVITVKSIIFYHTYWQYANLKI